MIRLFVAGLLAVSTSASAVIIRHDVKDSNYRVPASEFPALVDMPGEGHGVLIAPRWVVTAAHTITYQTGIKQVSINGVPRDVDRIFVHPGYKKPPQELLNQALASWDWTLFRAFLSSSDDIALIRLVKPVTDITSVELNKSNDEVGQIVKVLGKGATGNGVIGHEFSDSHRTELRRSYNKITTAHDRWLCFTFDEPSNALPLEGGAGSGDSGGPFLVMNGNNWLLAGMTSWTDAQSTNRTPGRYGQITCGVRLSHYGTWIESVISGQP